MQKRNKTIIFIFLVLGVLIASLPLFRNTIFGVYPHDTFFHTQRILSIQKALEAGQFPVRIYAEIYSDYGYAAPMFYPDIFMYIPAILCMLGVPLVISYNLFVILVNVVTILIAYYSFLNITKSEVVGMLATLLYTLSTYRLVDLHTRASVGEFLALIFCPLVIWGFTAISRGEYKKWPVLAFAYTGLFQSHMLTTIMMVMVGIGFVVLLCKTFWNKKAILAFLKAVGLAILLNLWFLVPFIKASQMNVIAFIGNASYWQTGANVKQLWDFRCLTAAGSEHFDYGATPSMPKTPGVILLIGALCFLVMLIVMRFVQKKKLDAESKRGISYLLVGCVATSMVTYLFPWDLIQKINILKNFFQKFQFMWRWNVVAILFLSVAAAYGFYYLLLLNKKYMQQGFICLLVLICLSALPYIGQYLKYATEYTNEEAIERSYMDTLYLVPGFNTWVDGNVASNIEGILMQNVERGYLEVALDFTCETKNTKEDRPYIDVPLTAYPGYKAYIDEREVEAIGSVFGLVRVYIPDDIMQGTLRVVYEESPINKIATVVSALTVLGIIAFAMKKGAYKK